MKRACEKISRLASDQLERKLSVSELIAMRFHFLMCSACRAYRNNLKLLHQTLKFRHKQHAAEHNNAVVLPAINRKKISKTLSKFK